MANKCTPKPASFDCFLITNNSRWESKICTYKKTCWSCLSRLPRSLLLKQICTFCSPGIDTSRGWTRTLPPAAAGSVCRRQCLPALPGLGGGSDPSWDSSCLPRPPHVSALAHGRRAREGSKEPQSNISVLNCFPRGAHGLPESQISEQGVISSAMGQEVQLSSLLW